MQPGTDNRDSSPVRDDEYAAAPASAAGSTRFGKPVRRARIGLLLLMALLTEVIVIAAVGNQAVTKKLGNHGPLPLTLKNGLKSSAETFQWRFAPRAHDLFHVWGGDLALIGTTVVLSLLLILVLLRGPLTFGRAFVGTWLSVIVATMVGGYVRGLVIDTPSYSRDGIAARALFSQLAPGSTVFLGGVALGLITALVVGVLGVGTRHPAEIAAVPVPVGDEGEQGYAGAPDQYRPDERFFDADPDRERGLGQPRGVPWQDDRATSSTAGYERPAEQRADATDTTMLPTMRGRGYGSRNTDSATTDSARTDDARADATRTNAVTAPRGTDATAMSSRGDERRQPSAADSAHTTALPRVPHEPATAEPATAEPDVPGPREPAPASDETQPSLPRQTAPPARSQQEHDEATRQFPRPPDDEDLDPESHR